jgi:NAD kinase
MRDKVVLVTRKTQLAELIERFHSKAQAKFLLEARGESLADAEDADQKYRIALDAVKAAIPKGVRLQLLDRSFLPNYLFGPRDLVVTLGPDGLVVNTAKYLSDQPLVAVNPDPGRIDGVLVAFHTANAPNAIRAALDDVLPIRPITMAVAQLDDGQKLFAVNDLFIGQRTHVSARYRIAIGKRSENQSSSGIIVSTGAGSSGWYRSVLAGAAGVAKAAQPDATVKWQEKYQFDRTAKELRFSVREPFVSKVSKAEVIAGTIKAGQALTVTSQMPTGGVIFSDGVESDFLTFESGRTATIRVADRVLNLI